MKKGLIVCGHGGCSVSASSILSSERGTAALMNITVSH